MPHVVIEYSAGVEDFHDPHVICGRVFAALAAHEAIPDASTLKVRAVRYEAWQNGTDPQSFAHATLSLLPGRDAAAKASLTACILAALDAELPDVGSLSVDVRELDPAYTKRVL